MSVVPLGACGSSPRCDDGRAGRARPVSVSIRPGRWSPGRLCARSRSDRSVFLFPEAGTMTEQAANALLKTLEEPTASVVFLLVAESEDDFPATVASRCRTIHVGRVPQATMVTALEGRGLDHAAAEGVAVVSGGRPGLALALMNRPEVSRFRDLWLAIPGQVTPHPGDGQRLAIRCVVDEIAPLVDQSVSEEMTKEREQRARRRAEQSLLVNGLEILASWYTDSASLQMGGPVRNSDLPLGDVHRCQPTEGRGLGREDPRCSGRYPGQSAPRIGAGQPLRRSRIRDLTSVPRPRYLRHRGCRWGRPTPKGRSGRR